MNFWQTLFFDIDALLVNMIVMVGALAALAFMGIWDQHNAKEIGVHEKSKHRELLLASEMPACRPVAPEIAALDPINALYDTEYSYPESCPPVSAKAKTKTT